MKILMLQMKFVKLLVVIAVFVFVNSCVNTKRNSYCQVATIIYLNDYDIENVSPDLARDILIHNETYESICNGY